MLGPKQFRESVGFVRIRGEMDHRHVENRSPPSRSCSMAFMSPAWTRGSFHRPGVDAGYMPGIGEDLPSSNCRYFRRRRSTRTLIAMPELR